MTTYNLKLLKENLDDFIQEHHRKDGIEYPDEILKMPLSVFLDRLKIENKKLYKTVEKFIENNLIVETKKEDK